MTSVTVLVQKLVCLNSYSMAKVCNFFFVFSVLILYCIFSDFSTHRVGLIEYNGIAYCSLLIYNTSHISAFIDIFCISDSLLVGGGGILAKKGNVRIQTGPAQNRRS
jgi:hypothetical protein